MQRRLLITVALGWLCIALGPLAWAQGMTAAEFKEQREAIERTASDKGTTCWWVGSYQCRKSGDLYQRGAVQDIYTTSRAGCPSTQTLGDGSVWALIGKCRCQ